MAIEQNKPISASDITIALNDKASSSHTHTKSQITDFTHTHTKSNITDFPTSMPASDVYSWAKASSKPSYSWDEITSKPSSFPPATHTHSDNLKVRSGVITSGTRSYSSGTTTYTLPSLNVNEIAFIKVSYSENTYDLELKFPSGTYYLFGHNHSNVISKNSLYLDSNSSGSGMDTAGLVVSFTGIAIRLP